MKISKYIIAVLLMAVILAIGIYARFTPEGEFLEGGAEIEEGAFVRTMLYIYLGLGIPLLLAILYKRFFSKSKKPD